MRAGRGSAARPPRRAARWPGRPRRPRPRRRTTASSHASTASSSRWVDTRTALPRSRCSRMISSVASTPSGSTPSNGSSSSSTRRLVERGEHDRHPAPHAVREPGGDPVGGPREVEPLEQVLGVRLPPVGHAAQAGGELKVLPRPWPGGSARRRRGSSRRPRGPRCGTSDGVHAGHPDRPAVGGSTPASTRSVVDLPAPLRPTRATDAAAGTVRSKDSTAVTSPKATCSPETSTAALMRARVSCTARRRRTRSPSSPRCASA